MEQNRPVTSWTCCDWASSSNHLQAQAEPLSPSVLSRYMEGEVLVMAREG